MIVHETDGKRYRDGGTKGERGEDTEAARDRKREKEKETPKKRDGHKQVDQVRRKTSDLKRHNKEIPDLHQKMLGMKYTGTESSYGGRRLSQTGQRPYFFPLNIYSQRTTHARK